MRFMKIGELAQRAGVNVETVRYYERKGLLREPPRWESGYRDFPAESLVRLRFIRHAKALGFSLLEIQELLALRMSPQAACRDVQRRVEAKIADIQQKIRSLARIQRTLEEFAATCVEGASSSECPILDALEEDDQHE